MNWDRLEIFLLAAGCLAAFAGSELAIPMLISSGAGIVALVVALVGLEGIVMRQMKWGITQYVSETYQGIAAVALGLIMLTAGIGFGVLVFAQALHQEESLLGMIFSRPGFVLLLAGGLVFLRGLAGVIGALEWNASGLSRVRGVLERLMSAILLVLGAIGLASGGLEIIAPGTFRRVNGVIWEMLLGMLGIQ